MRLQVLGLTILLFPVALSVLAAQSELRKQSDAHQMFLLRDALSRRPRSSDFYVGEVACAFNETSTCEETFQKVLAAEPKPAAAKQIHQMLAGVALREGRYRRALQEIDALLLVDPNKSDAKGSRPLIEVLSRFPDQAVQGASTATVQMDDSKLPLLINGTRASYFFDTGANLSTLSESDALLFGMQIQETKPGGVSTDISGNRVSFRVAVAKSLALGGIELRNVAFLVAGNEQQPFVDMKPGERGLIGLPVLWAFGSMTWTRDGVFQADRSPATSNLSAANICFDDLDLITQASFERHALPFVLDTGAATSELWPKFAGVASDLVRKSGTHESHTVIGMGGNQKFEATLIPKVVLDLGGMSVALQPAHVLKTQQRDAGKWFYGNLGIDLLRQAQSVTINFKTMTLQLDNATDRRKRRE